MDDKQIIKALVRDLVEFAMQSKQYLEVSSTSIANVQHGLMLQQMADEVLARFTEAKQIKEDLSEEEKRID